MKTILSVGLAVGCIFTALRAAASQPLPNDLQLVASDSLPAHGTWISVQRWGKFPPSPVNWCAGRDDVLYYRSPSFGTNKIIIDDTTVDYSAARSMSTMAATDGPPMPGDGGSGGSGGGGGPIGPKYGSNDLWLEIELDTNLTGYVDLILHGATNGFWQLLSKTNLVEVKPWTFGEILFDDGTTNELLYTPLPDSDPPIDFFRTVGGDTMVSITPNRYHTAIEPCSPTDVGQPGVFDVTVSPAVPRSLTVVYTITGSAINGFDYTNISNTLVIPPNTSSAQIFIQPLYDTNLDFEESVTLTLVLTNGYLVSPPEYTATLWISDCASNFFSIVATNVPSPIGIDYFSRSNSLVLSYNYDAGGEPNNFTLFNTNHVFTIWSGVHGSQDEVKIAAVKRSVNGFTNGDLYFGSGAAIGWLSANGTSFNTNFCTLTNGVVTNAQFLRGGLYVDQTGVWSNKLIAVTSDSTPDPSTLKGVWQVDSLGNPQLIANIPAYHLEGVVTITNDATKWGPLAGRIITGDEDRHLIWAIDTNGVAIAYALGIDPEDFDIIPPNQDLYCVDYNGDQSFIVKLSRAALTNYVGSLLVTQAGETAPSLSSRLFIVTWNGVGFDVKAITYRRPDGTAGHFEHVTFAPINIPPL